MRVTLDNIGIVVEPETEFEEKWLIENYKESNGSKIIASIKRGVTPADIVGLRIHVVGAFVNP